MPRPNRYHPYSRNQASSQPPVTSPRYPSAPALRLPQPLSTIAENNAVASGITSFHPVHPGYIRAVTSDGTPLVARSILQGPNGTFHLQMEVVRYPSQVFQQQASTIPQQQQEVSSSFDPRLAATMSATGMNRADSLVDSLSEKSEGSVKSHDDDCAIETDDEDAIVDETGNVGHLEAPEDFEPQQYNQSMMEQRRMMIELMQSRFASRVY